VNQNHDNPWRMVALIGTIGMEFIFLTIGGAWIGRQLDQLFHLKPICLVIGIFSGIFFGYAGAVVTLKKWLKQ